MGICPCINDPNNAPYVDMPDKEHLDHSFINCLRKYQKN